MLSAVIRYQLSGICCFIPDLSAIQNIRGTLVGNTHKALPYLTLLTSAVHFLSSCLLISRAPCFYYTEPHHHKVPSSRVGVEAPSMGSTRPSTSVRDEDVERTHLLQFPALALTNNGTAPKIQGSKQWVPLVAGGYVFFFIPTQPTV